MPRFSVYLIDHDGDMETCPAIVDVPTDAEAMICAVGIAKDGAGAEVWDKSRLVCRVPTTANVAAMSKKRGSARVATLTPERRLEIAKKAVAKRWRGCG